MLGHLANTLILRTYVSMGMTVKQLVEHVREKVLMAYANEEVPFEYLARTLEADQGAARSSMSQILLNYQYSASAASMLSDLSISSFGLQHLGTDIAVKPTSFQLIFSFKEF